MLKILTAFCRQIVEKSLERIFAGCWMKIPVFENVDGFLYTDFRKPFGKRFYLVYVEKVMYLSEINFVG